MASSHLGSHEPTAWQAFEPKTSVDYAVLASSAFFGVTCPIFLFDGAVLFSYHPSAMVGHAGGGRVAGGKIEERRKKVLDVCSMLARESEREREKKVL